MHTLIKFTKNTGKDNRGIENEFKTLEEVQKYFCNLHNDNDGYFFYKRERNGESIKRLNIQKEDKLYFIFDKKIVAIAVYTGIPNPQERKNKFLYGYKIEKIKLICSPMILKNDPFKNQNSTYYIKDEDEALKKELENI